METKPHDTCTCTLVQFIVCFIIVTTIEFFCEDYDGNRRNPSDIWLENPQLKCRCLDNNFVICDSLPKPMCQDINGIFRKNMETWMNSSCVECACSNVPSTALKRLSVYLTDYITSQYLRLVKVAHHKKHKPSVLAKVRN